MNNSDVDLNNGILSIRQSKFGKSRFVPLADSTRAALVKYAKQRDNLCLHPTSEAFLISERGQRLQRFCRTPHIRQDLLRSWSTTGDWNPAHRSGA